MELSVKKIYKNAKLPTYAHEGDAGMDLYTVEDVVVKAQSHVSINTGIAMEIPTGYVGLVCGKSGLASKYGLMKSAGVIDSGYRGEIRVVIVNTTGKDYKFESGDKIAQMLIVPYIVPTLVEVEDLTETERNTRGFGSTGRS